MRGLVSGQLDEAEHWFAIALEAPDADAAPVQWLVTATDRALAAAYAKSPQSLDLTEALVARIPDHPTPHGAYAWHGAAEAVMDDDPAEGAPSRSARARRGRGDGGVVRHGGGGDARSVDRRAVEATSEAR